MSLLLGKIDVGGVPLADPAAAVRAREHLTIGGRTAVSTPADQNTARTARSTK
ncbi:hypothetical protein ABZY09_36325 [Streptomyces sp. NPDC002928]|uniref:hypothetical protein n=1 Tax=Streptomyces sp. NPDC002928 TaxID=3154440 RepID=UPI0033A19426